MFERGKNSQRSARRKRRELESWRLYREEDLKENHPLKNLFLELTLECNERCRHCGSNCGDVKTPDTLTLDEWKALLVEVRKDFDGTLPYLCVTGGEPLLYPHFFELMEYAQSLGFSWGMTTNGILIDDEVAARLFATGMKTVSVSVDGLPESHEWFRRTVGSYDAATRGVKALVAAAQPTNHVQVTTVVHSRNYDELDRMYDEFSQLSVRSWRVINVDPIGRASRSEDIFLSSERLRGLIEFIEEKRLAGPMEVCYGCSHYLGVDRELETRPWYFLCTAGLQTASITCNGEIRACLDIERRPELVQGNVRTDCFADVWANRFEVFRNNHRKQGACASCEHWAFCAGDSFHTWDFDANEPAYCLKGIVFN